MIGRRLFAVLLLNGVYAATAIETTNTITISDIYALEDLYVEQQYLFLPIGPPSDDVLVQPYGPVVPVDWKEFPKTFTKQMYAEMDINGYPLYRISIYEDPVTRETVYLNSYATEVYRLSPEVGYDPYAWLKNTFQIEDVSEIDEFRKWIYDPAHIASEFVLIPETFYADYESTQQELAAQELLSEPMSMMMSLPAVVTNLQMAINSTTNGEVELEIGWPTNFTNRLEIFATTNLVENIWEMIHTDISTSGTNNYTWSDSESTNTPVRFYIASNADLDTDGDSLADGLEIYVHGSDPDETDTDSDGLDDDVEVGASIPTDPSNSDRQAPTISITSPVNNIVVVP